MADRSLTLGTLFTANATQFISTVDMMKKKVGQLNATFASVGKKGAKGIDKASSSVTRLGKSMDKASGQADRHKKSLRGVAGALDRIKAAAKITAAFAAAAAAITAVTTALRVGLKEIVDYDQGLKNLQAITNSTDQEVAAMGETIKDVARTTKFSTAEVAEGMTLLGQAGFSATESIQAMQSVADLATGTLSNMQFTTDLMTTTIRAFGMSTVESTKAADIMANAINRSKLTIDKLRIAFNFVGAAAHQAGLTLEETAATMMVLANQGLRASTIGTGLRQVLSRLLAPTGKLREEFEANNIELAKVNPSIVGFRQALENLLPVIYDQADGTVDMAKAYQLFGLRGAQAAAVLASSIASGNYDKMLDLTYETGTAARMAAKQIEGLGLKLKNMADRARLIAVALGEAGLIGALGALLDMLKLLFTGIESFINTTFGNLLVSWIGWTVVIMSSIKAIDLLARSVLWLGKSIGTLITKIWAVITAQTSLNIALKTGTKAAITFGTSMSIALWPLTLIVAAIAAVVAAIGLWVTAGQRRIKALEKSQSLTTTHLATLKLYAGVLDDLAEKQGKGADITKEHGRAINRMTSDAKKLKLQLDLTGDSLDEHRQSVEEAFARETEIAVARQIELIKEYKEAVEDATFWNGVWNLGIAALTQIWTDFVAILKQTWDLFPSKADWAWLGDIIDEYTGLGWAFTSIWGKIEAQWDKAAASYKGLIDQYAESSDTILNKQEEVNQAFVRLAKIFSESKEFKGRPLGDVIDAVNEIAKSLGEELNTATIDQINEALGGVTLKLKEEQSKWKDSIDQLPVYFQEMYKDMDGLRKANFAKAMKAMQAELAGFEKMADQMNLSDEERAEARAAIRAKHLVKFESDQKKEAKVTEESVNDQLRALDILAEGTEEMYHRRTTSLINHYLKQADLAGDDKEKLLELEKEFNENIKKEQAKLNKELLSNDKQRHALTLQLQKQTVEEIKKLHKEIMEDLKEQLASQYDAIKSERDAFLNDLQDLDKSYEDTIRGIRQKTMTNEQKWNDDRTHAHDLMNKARREGDVELFKEAMSLAASLAREVKDVNGNTVKTIQSTVGEAERLVNQIHTQHRNLIQKEVKDRERQMRSLTEAIAEVDRTIVQFGKTIDAINMKEMVIKADKTIAALERVYNINNKFKKEWDDLEDKTIVLTIQYKYVGKKGGSGGAESSGEGGGETSGEGDTGGGDGGGNGGGNGGDEGRVGGYVQRKLGGAVEAMMAIGGKLRGYGGGDKVKALLEPGEFVVRKEAVKKYGGHVFEGLNNMTTPSVAGSLGKRLGGMITSGFQRFQQGGGVPSHAALQANQQTFNIILRPKYLTGDRQAMRSMAKDVTKAVEEQSRRWGKK